MFLGSASFSIYSVKRCKLPGEYKIQLKPEIQPFSLNTPRRIPRSVIGKVKEELARME